MVVAAAIFAAPAGAGVVERVGVAATGGEVTRSLPRGVSIALGSPPDYRRATRAGAEGRWLGPRYEATGDATAGGDTSMMWRLRFAQASNPVAAASAIPTRGWPVDLKGGVSIEHVIRGRVVGTILGHYVLARSGPTGAAYEAAVAFAIAPRVFGQLRLEAPEPATDDAGGAGSYVVNDGAPVPASLWNRGQAIWAISNVRLLGALPPTRVSARTVSGGRVVRGEVADAFRHPVVGARISLQRFAGAWRTVTSTRVNARGQYAVRGVATRGRYRVVAAVESSTAASRPLVAGR